ncbi:clumping factor A-like [Polyergus mexicanus]|uniref:clumping factor A-like n=1 Tax=Polyergus mexicanus TaxID=615972 RepID=UPI0038B5165C
MSEETKVSRRSAWLEGGGGQWGPLDSAVGYGDLARVTKFSFHEYDEGTTEEIARETDYREHRNYDHRDADDRCDYFDCDDCQHKPEDRAATEKPDKDDDDDDDDEYDYEYDEDDASAEQDAAVDDDVDGPSDTDDDAEDGSCARPRCRCPRKFLVSRAIETLVAEATVARLLLNR